MSQNIQSLWAPEIKATVLSPMTILKGQAEALALQTGGVLLAEIVEDHEEGNVTLSFDLVAPALHGSRHRILRAIYSEDRLYPVEIEAEIFVGRASAFTDQQFTNNVAKVLKSASVLSVAQSLVARANEVLTERAPAQ